MMAEVAKISGREVKVREGDGAVDVEVRQRFVHGGRGGGEGERGEAHEAWKVEKTLICAGD